MIQNYNQNPQMLVICQRALESLEHVMFNRIGSMYGIYANIWGILMGSMLPYIPYMDPMGTTFPIVGQLVLPAASSVNLLGLRSRGCRGHSRKKLGASQEPQWMRGLTQYLACR